ncbi:MAG: hypothetical protein WA254_21635 [Candidatus Sulfotelmatobacter sp.]
MKVRWWILFFPVISVIVLSLLVEHHAAKASRSHDVARPAVGADSK